jgi:hypothetical protein
MTLLERDVEGWTVTGAKWKRRRLERAERDMLALLRLIAQDFQIPSSTEQSSLSALLSVDKSAV